MKSKMETMLVKHPVEDWAAFLHERNAALAAQMDSQQYEISSLRAEIAAQVEARNAEALAAEQQAQEKMKAHELRISRAVDFLMGSGSGHSRSEAMEAVRESLSLP